MRPTVGESTSTAASPAGRHVADGRGVAHDPGRTPLSRAGRGAGRAWARHPGAEPSAQERRAAVLPPRAPRLHRRAPGARHRPIAKRWRRHARAVAPGGTSATALVEQPRRACAAAHAPAGAAEEPVEGPRTGPALPRRVWSHRPTLATAASPPLGPRLPSRDGATMPAGGRDHGHGHGRLQAKGGATLPPLDLIMAPARIR